jgi:hypothetical protein
VTDEVHRFLAQMSYDASYEGSLVIVRQLGFAGPAFGTPESPEIRRDHAEPGLK